MAATSSVKQLQVPLPREHGAWAMFLAPVLVGTGAARVLNIPVLVFAITAFGFFLVRYPLMLAVKSRAPQARRDALKWSVAYGSIAGTAGLVLVAMVPSLTLGLIGTLGMVSLAIYLWLASRRAEMSTLGEWTGIAGLMLGAPGAYLVATGRLDETAVALYVLNLLYFGGTVFYVKFRVREQPRLVKPKDGLLKRLAIGRTTIVYHVLAVAVVIAMAGLGLAPALAVLGFVPMLCKAVGGVFTVPQRRLNIRRLGFVELGLTIVYASFIMLAFA